MYTFRCKTADQNGRIIEKTILADSKSAVKKILDSDGYYPLKISREGELFTFLKQKTGFKGVNSKDFLLFNQEFSVLIKAGLSVVAVLDVIIEKEDKSKLLPILKNVRNEIAAGESISGAFEKYPAIFPALYIASIKAGEKNGDIPLAVSRYIEHMKSAERIKQKVISSSLYPLILFTASCFVFFFLLIYVVPSLTESFIETDKQLPFITSILIDLSNTIRSGFFYILAIIGSFYFFIFYFVKTEKGRMVFDKVKVKIPFFGEIYLNYSISKLTRTLSSVLSGGIPLVETIKISSGTLNNSFLKRHLENAVKKIEEGSGFADSLLTTNAFPQLALRMISAGEGSGALEQVLNEIADFYENSVNTKLSILTSTIEPMLMIIMGFLIGFIVLAMYMPIFQMASTIS
ncbi:MAG: type II secretion system F family protein [Desulfosarcina sp.]|nr:type II secretion system F family protein [Desulfobacterales bacterium]